MNIWKDTVLTDKGAALQAKLLQGRTLKITGAKTGAGSVPAVNLRQQTDVTEERGAITLQPAKTEGDQTIIPVLLENKDLKEGYELWQIGFYAEDPDEGEILYCIAQAAKGKDIPAVSESPGFSITWDFYFQTSNTAPFEVMVNSKGLVRIEEYQIQSEEIEKIKNDIKGLHNELGYVSEIGKVYLDSINTDVKSSVINLWQTLPTSCVIDKIINLSEGMNYHISGYKVKDYGRVEIEVYGNTNKIIGSLYNGIWTWETETDRVIEIGSDNYWYWRKWDSGFLELYGSRSWASEKPTGSGPTYSYVLQIPAAGVTITKVYFSKANYGASTYSVLTGTTTLDSKNVLTAYGNVASNVSQRINLEAYVAARWK